MRLLSAGSIYSFGVFWNGSFFFFLLGWICLLWQTQATGLQVELHERKRRESEGRKKNRLVPPEKAARARYKWNPKMVHDPRGFAWKRSGMWTHSASLIPRESEEISNVLRQPRVGCKRNETRSLRSWQSGNGCSPTRGCTVEDCNSKRLRAGTETQAKTWFLRSERGY